MIEAICIAAYKKDLWLAKICCASIRYWYPDIPIKIIYDYSKGSGNLSYFINTFGATILDLPIKKFGWGLSKIEALLLKHKEKVLILDADTVIIGDIIGYLNSFKEDFVISADFHSTPYTKWMAECYFNFKYLNEQVDTNFKFPGYSFNTGQFVATIGLINRDNFNHLIQWREYPTIRYPNIFACADQGILNYILPKLEAEGIISIGKADFLLGIEYPQVNSISIDDLKNKKISRPYVLHWAGSLTKSASYMQRSDILKFYYGRIKNSSPLKFLIEDKLRTFSYLKERIVNKLKSFF